MMKRRLNLVIACGVWLAAVAVLAPSASAASRAYYVSPSGSDAVACSANGSGSPFATIQRAVGCSGDGDAVVLAPSGSQPYPGIGAVADNVVTEPGSGANARNVVIDAGQGVLKVSPDASVTVAGATLSCVTGCGGAPTVTNQGTLTLSGDAVTANTGVPSSAILNATPDGSASPASL